MTVRRKTFFGYCKDDGFVKRKKLGRIDAYNKWASIEAEWLNLYRNRDVKDGLSARQCVSYKDEWLCEAYMKTDYSKLTDQDYGQFVRNELAYQVKFGLTDFISKFESSKANCDSNKHYKDFRVDDIFKLYQGNGFELINMDICDNGKANFISRTSQDNGIVAKVNEVVGCKPFPAGLLTVALGGSVLSTFVQDKPFYTAFHIMVLKPKFDISIYSKLFLCVQIEANKYRYSYGRQANKTLKSLLLSLPINEDGIPDFEYMENYIKSLPYSDRI